MVDSYQNYLYYRNKSGLSDYQVANQTGISKSVFSDWKNGKHHPQTKTLKKIADLLGIDVNAFYNSVPKDYYQPLPPDSVPGTQRMLQEAKFKYNTSFSAVHDRVIEYNIKMTDGSSVLLTQDEYQELQDATSIFIDTWVRNKKKII